MSWQLGAFSLLALGLIVGFAWYERERPDARMVALVGTLAALAALGRIAFAAVPNVKPTTDIVLISGYALGGGPGFAVGALAGLTSNFFFGQGPWTPWQMAAWGATGVLGAGMAQLSALRLRLRSPRPNGARRPPEIGRWTLAVTCGLAGFAFTAIQDIGDWVTYSDHSFRQLGVYVGKGLGFDAIHAGSCLAFALVFGPALARSIRRFARRLSVTWLSPAAPLVAVVLVLGGGLGLTAPDAARAANTPATYLLRAENPDGGFGAAPGQPSAELYSGWAALGLASAGYDLKRVARGSHGLLAYVRAGAGPLSDVGSLERTILVVRAAGLSARSFAGHDLVASLAGRVRADGSVSGQVNLTAFAVLALRAAGVAPGAPSLSWLERQQARDGGFSFAGSGATSDVDDTGAVLEALRGEAGTADAVRARAVAYLRRQQNRDGGFSSQPGGASNAQSTAWAVQGLEAAHVDLASLHRGGSPSPLAFLRSLVAPGGSVRYARGVDQTPVWVTGEALMALERQPLPLAPRLASTSIPSVRPSPTAGAGSGRPPSPGRSAAPGRSARRASKSPALGPGTVAAPGDPIVDLVSGAGLITALVLAPLGLG